MSKTPVFLRDMLPSWVSCEVTKDEHGELYSFYADEEHLYAVHGAREAICYAAGFLRGLIMGREMAKHERKT